jgi:hypothetical protein
MSRARLSTNQAKSNTIAHARVYHFTCNESFRNTFNKRSTLGQADIPTDSEAASPFPKLKKPFNLLIRDCACGIGNAGWE